jgi:hypothetical protein
LRIINIQYHPRLKPTPPENRRGIVGVVNLKSYNTK